MTHARPLTPAAHAAHDASIVAALAARASDPDERAETAAREQPSRVRRHVPRSSWRRPRRAPGDPTEHLDAAQAARLPPDRGGCRPAASTGWRRVLGSSGRRATASAGRWRSASRRSGIAGPARRHCPDRWPAGPAVPLRRRTNVGVRSAAPRAGGTGRASPPRRQPRRPVARRRRPRPRRRLGATGGTPRPRPMAPGAAGGEPGEASVFTGANRRRADAGHGRRAASRPRRSVRAPVLCSSAPARSIAGLGLFGLRWSARRLLCAGQGRRRHRGAALGAVVRGAPRYTCARAHRTPDAARRLRAGLPRILRAPAAHHLEGRARERRVRVRQHRPARHRGPPARLPRRVVRPARPDVPARAVRGLQGDAGEDAGRPAGPVPEGPRGRQGAADPGLRDAGLRGRRRHRHDHAAARPARGPRDDDRHGRSRHAPARDAARPADDHALGASRTPSSTTSTGSTSGSGCGPTR